jgi:hypothetical protein
MKLHVEDYNSRLAVNEAMASCGDTPPKLSKPWETFSFMTPQELITFGKI